MVKGQFGVAGLGVMGQNVALNIERNGFPIVAYNRGADRADQMRQTAAGKQIQVSQSINEFVKQLERPRCILLMITAGKGTDAVIGQLKPLLEQGDVIIDGGNAQSWAPILGAAEQGQGHRFRNNRGSSSARYRSTVHRS